MITFDAVVTRLTTTTQRLRTVDQLAGGEPVLFRPVVTRRYSQFASQEVMGFELNTSF